MGIFELHASPSYLSFRFAKYARKSPEEPTLVYGNETRHDTTNVLLPSFERDYFVIFIYSVLILLSFYIYMRIDMDCTKYERTRI